MSNMERLKQEYEDAVRPYTYGEIIADCEGQAKSGLKCIKYPVHRVTVRTRTDLVHQGFAVETTDSQVIVSGWAE